MLNHSRPSYVPRPFSSTHIARRLGVRPQEAAGCPGQGSGGKGLSRDVEGLPGALRGDSQSRGLQAGARALQPEWPRVLCCDRAERGREKGREREKVAVKPEGPRGHVTQGLSRPRKDLASVSETGSRSGVLRRGRTEYNLCFKEGQPRLWGRGGERSRETWSGWMPSRMRREDGSLARGGGTVTRVGLWRQVGERAKRIC